MKEDEVQMIRAFVELAQRPDSDIPDLFFPFDSAFSKTEKYSDDLVDELYHRLQNEKENSDIDLRWQPTAASSDKTPTLHFINNFSSFARALAVEVLTVAYLNPPTWSAGMENWLLNAIASGIPDHLRLMVLDLADSPMLTRLADLYPDAVITIEPDLDMMTAIIQMASAGDPAHPGVKFRKAFVALSQAATKKDIPRFEQLAIEPLGIAREEKWKHLEVAVYALKGSTLLSVKKYKEALAVYEDARRIAQSAADQGDPTGQILALQMLLCKGSSGIAMNDYKLAAEQYALAGDKAEEAGDSFQLMEARRMQGYCLEQLRDKPGAWDAYLLSLDAGEKLDESMRKSSTLPYVAKSLLVLANTQAKKEEYFALENRLNTVLGSGWQDRHAQNATAT